MRGEEHIAMDEMRDVVRCSEGFIISVTYVNDWQLPIFLPLFNIALMYGKFGLILQRG